MGELTTLEAIDQTIVQSGFQGQKIRIQDIGKTQHGFERTNTIQKIQGHEAIIFNIQKSASTDILTAQKKVDQFTQSFLAQQGQSGFRVIMMDDESYDVRNRLSIIGSNGLIGFALIVLVLFFFLNFSTGFWVAMGIPFSLAITLIGAMLLGFSINNMTLAAIIIVLGIVVDDAIIIGESIARRLQTSKNHVTDAIESTLAMMKPVLASILTTCAAFVPLYFFSGRFGLFVKYIPTVVILMLFASLIESAFLLPSHIVHPLPWTNRTKTTPGRFAQARKRWVAKMEAAYQRALHGVLSFRYAVLLGFGLILIATLYMGATNMKYVMFPREQPKEIFINATAPTGINRFEMAKRIMPLEDMFLQNDMVVAVRSRIGQSRRGGEVRENAASIRVELLPPSERNVSLKNVLSQWESQSQKMEGLTEVRFLRSWWGSDSGSPIEIEIQQNDDSIRQKTVAKLQKQMEQFSFLINVEVERPITKREYKLHLNKAKASRLQVNFQQLAQTIRSYVEGRILYTLINGEEEVDVRLTSPHGSKKDIQDILSLYTSTNQGYLVPIQSIVEVEEIEKPANIARVNFKRATKVYADIQEGAGITPLEVAEKLETEIFPSLLSSHPSTQIAFRGEIENSREAQGDFGMSIVMVLLLIYILLIFLFNSLGTPLMIAAIIPFGTIGVILAFYAHGMLEYGFFAVVGTLGMIGVVINDAIVMLSQLEQDAKPYTSLSALIEEVAAICATRLRPVVLTTLTTVAGIFPTAYGVAGYDSMLAEMMLAMGWGLLFGSAITLVFVPCMYVVFRQGRQQLQRLGDAW
jgi:multidrug efflux pump subunit AcrB